MYRFVSKFKTHDEWRIPLFKYNFHDHRCRPTTIWSPLPNIRVLYIARDSHMSEQIKNVTGGKGRCANDTPRHYWNYVMPRRVVGRLPRSSNIITLNEERDLLFGVQYRQQQQLQLPSEGSQTRKGNIVPSWGDIVDRHKEANFFIMLVGGWLLIKTPRKEEEPNMCSVKGKR